MGRKRITQLAPWLLPLRRKQRIFCFYAGMRHDGRRYCAYQSERQLPFVLFQSGCQMYNRNTGFPMKYQENKIFNLKLAAKKLDGLYIAPGETFSFWRCVRDADREIPYRDGLVEVDGQLKAQYGGGLCQITNLLCWLFLHTPLTITERCGHAKKDFPEPPSDAPMGVDATVSEGWLDFKVRNDTQRTYQLCLRFDETHIIGEIRAERDPGLRWEVVNRNLGYFCEPEGLFEEVDVVQRVMENGSCISEATVYRNRCAIGYSLPAGTTVTERKAS